MRSFLLAALLFASATTARPATPKDEPGQARLAQAARAYAAGRFEAARPVLRQLSLQGVTAADTLLGVMAARGVGCGRAVCAPDPATAAAWFSRAAARDDPAAQLALAHAYARGSGVPVNRERALKLARSAAARGQPGAAALLVRLER